MAKVWFVKRRGAQWIAPGGAPAYERALAELIFPLDLGTHRRLVDDEPVPEPRVPPEEPQRLQRVMVETTAADLHNQQFSGYEVAFYDSPYSPREAARRLGPVHYEATDLSPAALAYDELRQHLPQKPA